MTLPPWQKLVGPLAVIVGLLIALSERTREPLPPLRIVDFHCELTSEKNAFGLHLDGRVSAVVGTHTHVATADETIRPGGTAYLTDVGMTGAYEGIIGFARDRIIEKFLSQTPRSFETAKRDIRLSAAVIAVDEETGKATAIERVQVRVD